MTAWENFYERIQKLEHDMQEATPDLEVYLRSLLGLVQKYQNQPPSLDLFYNLIDESFKAQPIEFDEQWLKISDPPIEDYELMPSEAGEEDEVGVELVRRDPAGGKEDFDFLVRVLTFQIAELKRMQGNQLESKYRYFGVESEKGHYWYNFEPFDNIGSGIRGYIDTIKEGVRSEGKISWKSLADILELGRIYE